MWSAPSRIRAHTPHHDCKTGASESLPSTLLSKCDAYCPWGSVLIDGQHHCFFQFSAHHTSVPFQHLHPLVPDVFNCYLIFWSGDDGFLHQARLAKSLSTVCSIVLPSNFQGKMFKLFLIHNHIPFQRS